MASARIVQGPIAMLDVVWGAAWRMYTQVLETRGNKYKDSSMRRRRRGESRITSSAFRYRRRPPWR
jgi:hypothetical protein